MAGCAQLNAIIRIILSLSLVKQASFLRCDRDSLSSVISSKASTLVNRIEPTHVYRDLMARVEQHKLLLVYSHLFGHWIYVKPRPLLKTVILEFSE